MPPDPLPSETDEADIEPLQAGWLTADLVHDAGSWGDIAALRRAMGVALGALTSAAAFEAQGAGEVCIALSDDASVQKLNATYRGKDKPTNVLSFPAATSHEQSGLHMLGDIVLARETLEREAAALSIPLLHHVQHLTIHGVLHLLGHDHETDEDAEIMERLETRILASIGVPDPYETAAGSARSPVMSE